MTRIQALELQESLYPRKLSREYLEMGVPHPDNIYFHTPPTLLDICLRLRWALNGSGSDEPYDAEFVQLTRDMLQARLDTWHPSPWQDCDDGTLKKADAAIDAAVRVLVMAAVAMADVWLKECADKLQSQRSRRSNDC